MTAYESWLARRQEDHDRPEPDTRSFDCVLLRHDACDTTVWDPDTEGTTDCGCDCHEGGQHEDASETAHHELTIEFDGDTPFFAFACHAPADALCHAEWSCACEEWDAEEVRHGVPAHRITEYDDGVAREAWHAGEFKADYCGYRDWFDNSDERVNGTVVVPVRPEFHGDYYTFEIGGES